MDIVGRLDVLVTTNSPELAGAGTNLTAFSRQLIQFANSLNLLLASNTPGINHTIQNVESSSALLKSAMEDVQSGKGLAGAMLKNEQIVANLTQISQNLAITTSNLNQVGLWGILWRHHPPRPAPAKEEPLSSPKGAEQ